MLRRYELTDEEWLRIEPLLPPENTGKQGRPRKDNRIIMNGIVWLARSGAPWRDLPERYGSNLSIADSENGSMMVSLIIFSVF